MSSLKSFSPTTASMRHHINISRKDIWKGRPVKALTEGLTKTGGRNHFGRITSRYIGGGHKRLYRIIDFKRLKDDVPATIERIEYDPNRSARIALIQYTDGEQAYIIAPAKVAVGDKIMSGVNADIKPGNAMPLRAIPVGTVVHNVELKIGAGAQMARSAGTFAQIIGRDSGYIQLRLASGELRMVHGDCRATIGSVSNPEQKNVKLGKAGRNRWLGKRPHVRGVAMNPVDHPHGGGEGKTSGGRHPVTPWGKCTKGKKTRSRKKPSSKYIIRRRNSK